MDFIPYRLFSIVPPFLVVSKCALAGGVFKPPSGREGDHEVVEGACVTLGLYQLSCYALSLSRLRRQLPPGGSLLKRSYNFRGWALPEAFVKQMRNWRDKQNDK